MCAPGQSEKDDMRSAPANERSRFQKREFMISHQVVRNLRIIIILIYIFCKHI